MVGVRCKPVSVATSVCRYGRVRRHELRKTNVYLARRFQIFSLGFSQNVYPAHTHIICFRTVLKYP